MACVGIDLGTTYSVVSVYKSHEAVPIYAEGEDTPLVPSLVTFKDGQQLVGHEALANLDDDPENNIYEIKRLMGRSFNDALLIIKKLLYRVVQHEGKLKIKIDDLGKPKYFIPEEISAMILRTLKAIAEKEIKKEVTHAVITVPAYFTDAQRQATVDAGTLAGLNVLRVINEPTAAAVAYGLDDNTEQQKKVLIYDLGGGTFDVSILCINVNKITVLSTHGHTYLGGTDFVDKMVEFVAKCFQQRHKEDFTENAKAMQRVRQQCEVTKRRLSTHTRTSIVLTKLHKGNSSTTAISRRDFEEMNLCYFQKTMDLVDEAMVIAKVDITGIDDIILVGGSTHIPIVQKMLQEKFNVDELIVLINRDEVVSLGAAIQAAVLNGEKNDNIRNLLLQDVTPLTLGIAVDEGLMSDVIPRCSRTPIKQIKTYTTTKKNHSVVQIKVFEGERPNVKDNRLLGEFTLSNIPPAPAGRPSIRVTFDIDENGILRVTAQDKEGGVPKSRTVASRKGNLTTDEIEHLLKSAEVYKEEDLAQKKKATARSNVRSLTGTMLYRLQDGDLHHKLDPHDLKKLEQSMKKTLTWLDTNKSLSTDQYEAREREIRDMINSIDRSPDTAAAYMDNVD